MAPQLSGNSLGGSAVCRSLVVVSVLFVGFATIAFAQDEQRHGFWFGFGLGYGPATFACDSCDYRQATANSSTSINGGTISFAAGGTPSPRFRVGGEWRKWLHGQDNDSIPETESFNLLFAIYAREQGGPFLEAGVGLSEYYLQKAPADLIESGKSGTFVSGSGLEVNLGVGWEFRVLSPRIVYSIAREDSLSADHGATVATGWRHHVLLFELGMRGVP